MNFLGYPCLHVEFIKTCLACDNDYFYPQAGALYPTAARHSTKPYIALHLPSTSLENGGTSVAKVLSCQWKLISKKAKKANYFLVIS